MLVGSIDWIQVLPNGGLHVIDFKTGKNEEDEHSLQLPIYFLLGTSNLQGNIEKVSYWYLEKDDGPVEMTLKSPEFYLSLLREKAQEIKKAIDNGKLICRAQSGRCQKCEKYEKIISKEAEFVGFDRKMKREIYYIENSKFQIPNSN
jgi:RecB family exonuclease